MKGVKNFRRRVLACPVDEWMEAAITLPGVRLLELTSRIAVASTRLPGNFHQDPADQIIVATARVYHLKLLTVDERILKYEYVSTL
jgi:PIN domain nuclease of toxin-antitoxin system